MFRILVACLLLLATSNGGRAEPAREHQSLQTLIERLRHLDVAVRSGALATLSSYLRQFRDSFVADEWLGGHAEFRSFRLEAQPLVPQLLELLNSADEDVVSTALEVLTRLGPKAGAAIPVLKAHYLQPGFDPQRAFSTLLMVLPEDEPLGPAVLQYLRDLPPEELASLHEQWSVVTKLLAGPTRKVAESDSWIASGFGFSAEYIGILLRMSGHTIVEVPFLVQASSAEYPPYVRGMSICILASLEEEALAALPALRRHLHDADPVVRLLAGEAIVMIEQREWEVPALIALLKLKGERRTDFENFAREFFEQHSVASLRESFIETPETPILDLLDPRKFALGSQRRDILRGLQAVGLPARAAIPAIRELLQDSDPHTRQAAADALWSVDPELAAWVFQDRSP